MQTRKEFSSILASSNTSVKSSAKFVTTLDRCLSRSLGCASSMLPLLSEASSQSALLFSEILDAECKAISKLAGAAFLQEAWLYWGTGLFPFRQEFSYVILKKEEFLLGFQIRWADGELGAGPEVMRWVWIQHGYSSQKMMQAECCASGL